MSCRRMMSGRSAAAAADGDGNDNADEPVVSIANNFRLVEFSICGHFLLLQLRKVSRCCLSSDA